MSIKNSVSSFNSANVQWFAAYLKEKVLPAKDRDTPTQTLSFKFLKRNRHGTSWNENERLFVRTP